VYTDGAALLQATAQREMEGVLAKRRDVAYVPGTRSPGWVEVTHRRTQACLVGGWCAARGGPPVAALLLGLPEGGRLRYAGRVDAAPLDIEIAATLRDRLRGLAADRPPFVERLPRAETAAVRWCAPRVAVAVDHLGPDGAGRLRRPVLRAVLDGPAPPLRAE
jgi:bifunctional non-homologous end joining protein LigD